MKRIRPILAVLFSVFVALMQVGCQEQAKAPGAISTDEAAIPPKSDLTRAQPAAAGPAEPAAAAQAKTTAKGPRITFEKTVHDFGEVGPLTRHTCEFKFTNTGNEVLKIEGVKTCCGFKGSLVGEKTGYGPGQSGVVKLTYSARTMSAKVVKQQYVLSNDPENPKVALTIKANLVLKVRCEPSELKLVVQGEDADTTKMTLRSVDGTPFAVRSFKAVAGCLTADVDPNEEATKIVLNAKFDPDKLKNRTKGYVRIGLTHPQCRMINVPFEVLPRFATNPLSIIVRKTEPGKPVNRDIWILNNYGDDFSIESVSSDKGIVRVVGQEKIDRRYKIQVEVVPPESSSRVFSDVLRVNIKGGAELAIRCHGYYAMNI